MESGEKDKRHNKAKRSESEARGASPRKLQHEFKKVGQGYGRRTNKNVIYNIDQTMRSRIFKYAKAQGKTLTNLEQIKIFFNQMTPDERDKHAKSPM